MEIAMNHEGGMQIALDEFWIDCVYHWMWKYQDPIMKEALARLLLG